MKTTVKSGKTKVEHTLDITLDIEKDWAERQIAIVYDGIDEPATQRNSFNDKDEAKEFLKVLAASEVVSIEYTPFANGSLALKLNGKTGVVTFTKKTTKNKKTTTSTATAVVEVDELDDESEGFTARARALVGGTYVEATWLLPTELDN